LVSGIATKLAHFSNVATKLEHLRNVATILELAKIIQNMARVKGVAFGKVSLDLFTSIFLSSGPLICLTSTKLFINTT
jgi:hypothetical protein